MYRVIIVDDELSVRNRLKTRLEKQAGVFEIVGCFENGFDALEGGISLSPDVLITDIRRPYIDGIELIRQFKRDLPLVQTIIVSGFDSFDYAKEAISLGVIGYLTKPVSSDEFDATMNKAKEILDNQYQKDRNRKSLEEKAQSSVRFLQSEDLKRLITVKELTENLNGKLKNDGIDLSHPYQLMVVFDADKENLGFEQQEVLYFSLKNTIQNELSDSYVYYLFLNDNQLVRLLEFDGKPDEEWLMLKLNETLARIKRGTKISVSCGVSDVRSQPINYRKIYRHAKRSLEYRTVLGTNAVFSFRDLEEDNGEEKLTNGKIDENEFKNLTYVISYGEKEEAKRKIKKMISQISTPQYRENYNYILSNILDAILKACISLSDFYRSFDSHVEILESLFQIKTQSSLVEFFCQIIDRVVQVNESKRLSGLQSSYDRILQFLEVNYTNPNLSIEDVANELAYSVSYISAILKKNGTTFTKVTTDLRRKKALKLLSDSNNRIINIARDVGYADPYYFSHCFKKYTGRSPDEYRKKKLA